MRFLLEPAGVDGLPAALEAAHAARAAGLDGLLLSRSAALPAPLVVAAAVGPAVADILIAAEVTLGDRHPVELAEEAAVTDLAAGGRLVLVAAPVPLPRRAVDGARRPGAERAQPRGADPCDAGDAAATARDLDLRPGRRT
jgi:alkanesulfonate monooxygenase SsuD/methylene tetrahydromethanopterin reductase-like flavin-dependent oxidoreductase (luciferase family)